MRPAAILALLLAAGPAAGHDWYTGLTDARGRSCCDLRDCRPVGMCVPPGRGEGIVVEGECLPVPLDKVLGVASPDGGAHACWDHLEGRPNLLCVVLPGAS